MTVENKTMTTDDMLADTALRTELVDLYRVSNTGPGALTKPFDRAYWAAHTFAQKHSVYTLRVYDTLKQALAEDVGSSVTPDPDDRCSQ